MWVNVSKWESGSYDHSRLISHHIDFLKFILPPACRRRCRINGNSIPARKLRVWKQRAITQAVFTGRIKGRWMVVTRKGSLLLCCCLHSSATLVPEDSVCMYFTDMFHHYIFPIIIFPLQFNCKWIKILTHLISQVDVF